MNFIEMLQNDLNCGRNVPTSPVKIIFQLTILMGSFPAVLALSVMTLVCCMLPFYLYEKLTGYLD